MVPNKSEKKSSRNKFHTGREIEIPLESKDLPATQGMLYLVRGELKADIRELRSEMKSDFNHLKAADHQLSGQVERVLSEVARIGILVEEQNSRNQIVLEGLISNIQRQEAVQSRLNEVEDTVRIFTRSQK